MEKLFISEATKRNWRQNNISSPWRLQSRANKTKSNKNIIPKEYFYDMKLFNICEKCLKKWFTILQILYSIALGLSKNIKNENIKIELKTWKVDVIIDELYFYDLELEKWDILWWVYQFLKTEWEKSMQGSYYTPDRVVLAQIKDYFQEWLTLLDPCCGTGQYLMNIETDNPLNIYWCDIDEVAIKIARINLMIKYSNFDFFPNIFHFDFLSKNIFDDTKFDLIITNPPWWAQILWKYNNFNIKSWEIFSYFIEKWLKNLKKWWILSYILPESILNVWIHKDIRNIILKHNIQSIFDLWKIFNGVFTNVIRIDIINQKEDWKINIYLKNWENNILDKKSFQKNNDYIFSIYQNQEDERIFSKIFEKKHFFLDNKNTDWALWIVTWDNKKFISEEQKENYIPVYTWKEVDYYRLKWARKFLLYEPKKFQQMASLDKYQKPQKIIYKFISKKLVFALDEEWVFTLNSANILIPKIDYSLKVIVSLFNSELYQRMFEKKFSSIKVLKSHIQSLPLPIFEEEKVKEIEKIFDEVIAWKAKKIFLDNYLFYLLTN